MQIVNQLQDLIDTKTRQLDIDFKNLDYAEDMQQEPLPKVARSSSPTNSNGVKSEFGAYGPSTTHQRGSTPTSQNSERNSSNGDRNFNGKRTRRPRNDMDNDSHSASENSSSVKNGGNGGNGHGLNISGGGGGGGSGSSGSSSKNNKSSGQNSGNGGNSSNSKQKKKRKARQGREREESPPPDHIDPDEPTYCLCDQVGSRVDLHGLTLFTLFALKRTNTCKQSQVLFFFSYFLFVFLKNNLVFHEINNIFFISDFIW